MNEIEQIQENNEMILDELDVQGFENLETEIGERFVYSVMDNWQKRIVIITDRDTGIIQRFEEANK